MSSFGIHPLPGYILAFAGFGGLSALLFSKTVYADSIIFFMALAVTMSLNEPGRNNFLKYCFPRKKYYALRITENLILSFPFIIIMAVFRAYLPAILLPLSASLLVLLSPGPRSGFVIPTPFYKRPFEFIVGFRNTFPLLIIACFLALMSVVSGNFTLGVFAVLLVFLLTISFYTVPEHEFFVWIFNSGPRKFILDKITTAVLFSTLLCLPVSCTLMAFFPSKLIVIIGLQLLGCLYLSTMVLVKYSRFPQSINLPEAAIIALSLWFPPMLIAIIPYFYMKSVKRLNEIL